MMEGWNGTAWVQLHCEDPSTGRHGFRTVDGPTVTRVTFWTDPRGGRPLSRAEAEELLGAEWVRGLIGDGEYVNVEEASSER